VRRYQSPAVRDPPLLEKSAGFRTAPTLRAINLALNEQVRPAYLGRSSGGLLNPPLSRMVGCCAS